MFVFLFQREDLFFSRLLIFRLIFVEGVWKQGSDHVFPEETGHGCTTSRSCDRDSEADGGGRPSVSCTKGRYGKENIENKAAAEHRRHNHSWDAGLSDVSASFNSWTRQRSVDDLLVTNTYHANFDVGNSALDESQLKDQHDKLGGVDGLLGTGQIYDKDHSLDSITWKALKWTRSGSLTSGSKSFKCDLEDARVELQDGRETLLRSPAEDPAEGMVGTGPAEGGHPRKKQRLGWGQGLAKYEKQKVEGPEDACGKSGLVHCNSSAKDVHNTCARSLPGSSVLVCTTPATLCSVDCSSSSG